MLSVIWLKLVNKFVQQEMATLDLYQQLFVSLNETLLEISTLFVAPEEPPSPQEAAQAVPAGGGTSTPGGTTGTGAAGGGADSESDDSEVGRLQALWEARGLPPHLFGALGPRVQHLLHRSMGANSCKSYWFLFFK